MQPPPPNFHGDEPLPATLRFVLSLGALLFLGWLLMFALLLHRWA
jgi:hypothetical protein